MEFTQAKEYMVHSRRLIDLFPPGCSNNPGVYSRYSDMVFVDKRTMFTGDAVLSPNVHIRGYTRIGRDVVIDAGTIIEDSEIGDNVSIGPGNYLVGARIKDGVTIGPRNTIEHATVNECSKIGSESKIDEDSNIGSYAYVGDKVTIRRSVIGDHTQVPYNALLADSEVGSWCNIAWGVLTSNFPGYRKYGTIIGDGCFVGTCVNFLPPVEIKNQVRIFPGVRIASKSPIKDHTWVFDQIVFDKKTGKGRIEIDTKPSRAFRVPGYARWVKTRKELPDPDKFSDLLRQVAEDCANKDELADMLDAKLEIMEKIALGELPESALAT